MYDILLHRRLRLVQFDAIVAGFSQVLWCSDCVLFTSIILCNVCRCIPIMGVNVCIMIVLHAEISIPYSMVENANTIDDTCRRLRRNAVPEPKMKIQLMACSSPRK